MPHRLRYRQVHLDFHTSPHITEIGEAFDEMHWQSTLRRGNVDSITLFATCHHGYAYYDTQVGERHPHLGFDLLRRQFNATKAIDVNVPIYLTAGVNNWASHNHPEWREVGADGRYCGWVANVTDAGFHTMCFNSPYLGLLCRQIEEVAGLFPNCDGIFLDIITQNECCCRWCLASMAGAGLNACSAEDRQANATEVLLKYYQATTTAAKTKNKDMPVFHNSGHITRGQTDILDYFTHLELESLPTGGWGYDHFPLSARYVAQLPHDVLAMTGKFHTTWAEFGGYKHPNALRYECAAMLAHGTKCSVGDQLHPNGKLDESTYDLIGAAYAEVKKNEPYCEGAINIADIGLLSSSAINRSRNRVSDADVGAARILLEGHFLFNVLDAGMDFLPYTLLILPDDLVVDDALKAKLDAYLADGGRLLLTGRSGLNPEQTQSVFDLGATLHGPSEFEPDYILPIERLQPNFCASPMVMYRRATRLKAATGKSLGEVYDPYFNRTFEHFCSHQHTPYQTDATSFDLGVAHGNVTYLAHPVFTIYAGYGSVAYRQFLTKLIDQLLGDACTLRTNLPSTARVMLTHQPHENRHVLHLLYANTVLRGGSIELSGGTTRSTKPIEVIEELVTLSNVEVRIPKTINGYALDNTSSQDDLKITQSGGTMSVCLRTLECHKAITFSSHRPVEAS